MDRLLPDTPYEWPSCLAPLTSHVFRFVRFTGEALRLGQVQDTCPMRYRARVGMDLGLNSIVHFLSTCSEWPRGWDLVCPTPGTGMAPLPSVLAAGVDSDPVRRAQESPPSALWPAPHPVSGGHSVPPGKGLRARPGAAAGLPLGGSQWSP